MEQNWLAEQLKLANEEVASWPEYKSGLPISEFNDEAILAAVCSLENRAKQLREELAKRRGLSVGNLTILDEGKEVSWKGQKVDLTLSHFYIVKAMVGSLNKTFSYKELYEIGFNRSITFCGSDSSTITRSHIKRIRLAFLKIDENFNCIKNRFKYGYRWEIS